MNAEAKRIIEAGLWPGEQLLWVGGPDPSRSFVAGDGCRIPFMIAWTGFAVVWTLVAVVGGGLLFAVWGLAFVGIGTWNLIGPILRRRQMGRTVTYAITSRRAIIRDDRGDSFEVPVEQWQPVVSRSRQGPVTVEFVPSRLPYRTNLLNVSQRPLTSCFVDVLDSAALLAAIDQARSGARDPSPAGEPPPPPPPPPSAAPGADRSAPADAPPEAFPGWSPAPRWPPRGHPG